MGTKANPGRFDCYARAEPDEPVFVLLGRDPDAPMLIRLWAEIRKRCGESGDKLVDAMQTANAMEDYRADLERRTMLVRQEDYRRG